MIKNMMLQIQQNNAKALTGPSQDLWFVSNLGAFLIMALILLVILKERKHKLIAVLITAILFFGRLYLYPDFQLSWPIFAIILFAVLFLFYVFGAIPLTEKEHIKKEANRDAAYWRVRHMSNSGGVYDSRLLNKKEAEQRKQEVGGEAYIDYDSARRISFEPTSNKSQWVK